MRPHTLVLLNIPSTIGGIFSSLQVADLDRIRRTYKFSDGFSLAIPTEDAYIHQPEFVTLYEHALVLGLCLPLYPLTQDLLIFLSIMLG